MRLTLVLGLVGAVFLASFAVGKKKNKEDETQTLNVPRDPPPAIAALTRRLVFHTSTLSAKGLLSQQTHDAVRDILKQNGGTQIVKLRAFVAGTGDLRRVPQIVSETFTDKKHLLLPVVSVFQVGGLPLEGAQIVLESVSEAKRNMNPNGLLFVSAREHSVDQPLQPLAGLAEQSLADLTTALAGRGEVLKVTCFASMLSEAAGIRAAMTARFPAATLDLVQAQRASARSSVACDAVARATGAAGSSNPGIGFVSSDRLVLSGSQLAFGFTDDDARLAFRRMDRLLSPFGASMKSATVLHLYPLSESIAAQVNKLRPEFASATNPPSTTMLRLEGLPGMDASFAIEVVAPATLQGPSLE
jgi:enamine deaminase RidA (YjgF/YER057c/UK114 family)